jgi:hypothetical protein
MIKNIFSKETETEGEFNFLPLTLILVYLQISQIIEKCLLKN